MENKLTAVKIVASKLIQKMVEGDKREWPPSCLGLLYQPERPQVRREETK